MERGIDKKAIVSVMLLASLVLSTIPAMAEEDIVPLTNSITERVASFNNRLGGTRPRWWTALAIYSDIKALTNVEHRLVAARHFGHEVLHVNLSNENYRIRFSVLIEQSDVIDLAWRALVLANAAEAEHLDFLFDALEHYKYGCYVTSYEPLIEEPLHGDYGRIAQRSCVENLNWMKQAKTHVGCCEYAREYKCLSAEGRKYFRNRYKSIFGVEFEEPSD